MAIAIVMQEAGLTVDVPPIFWREGGALDCGDGLGFVMAGNCNDGATIVRDDIARSVHLAWREGDTWASVALAHELVCHVSRLDPEHAGACAEGSPLLARVHAALVSAFPGEQPWWSEAR